MLRKFVRPSTYARNVITFLTGTAFTQALPIAFSPILTRLYTPADFGVFAMYMAATSSGVAAWRCANCCELLRPMPIQAKCSDTRPELSAPHRYAYQISRQNKQGKPNRYSKRTNSLSRCLLAAKQIQGNPLGFRDGRMTVGKFLITKDRLCCGHVDTQQSASCSLLTGPQRNFSHNHF